MDELLKEVTLSERRKLQIDSFIQTVTKLLQAVPDSPEVEVCSSLAVRKLIEHIEHHFNLFMYTDQNAGHL